jgi:hypothetical protein
MRDREQARAGDDFVAAEIAKSPRLLGYCGVHPLEPWAVDELDRCASLPGMIGLKLHVNEQSLDLARQDVAAVDRLLAAAEPGSWSCFFMRTRPGARGEARRASPGRAIDPATRCSTVPGPGVPGHALRDGQEARQQVPANLFADVSSLVTYYADSPFREQIAWGCASSASSDWCSARTIRCSRRSRRGSRHMVSARTTPRHPRGHPRKLFPPTAAASPAR